MSWDIELVKDGALVKVDHFIEGGTYQVGGTNRASLNVTYNYSMVTKLVGFSFSSLHGKKAKNTIKELKRVYEKLGDIPYEDYWAPTPGNAGHAVGILLKWAEANHDAIWEVS